MPSNGDLNYNVTLLSATAILGSIHVSMDKVKLNCIHEGLASRIVLRFGKGTEDTSRAITASFDIDAGHLEHLEIMLTWEDKKAVNRIQWNCQYGACLLNYDPTKEDLTRVDHKFAAVLRNAASKRLRVVAPNIKSFSLIEWRRFQSTCDAQLSDQQSMLSAYPNPFQITKPLIPISQCKLRAAVNTFPSKEMWGTVMNVSVLRELHVLRARQGVKGMESCWGIFERVGNDIFCHVYGHPAGKDRSQIIIPPTGDFMKLSLRTDGSRDLSITGRQQYQNVTVVDTGKHADFIVRLEDSQGWTTDDMNFGDMSTISLERRENDISTRRHLSSINACYATIYTPSTDLNSFPLQRLLLLNQSAPINQSLTGASLSTEIRQNLSHMASSLNETQRQAFNISHLTGSSAVVVQGPPGTGKTHVLTLTTIAYAMARKKKCLVATPSNNAANEFAEKVMRMWTDGRQQPPWNPHPTVIRWLTPTNDRTIMSFASAPGISDSMANISMANNIKTHVRWLADGRHSSPQHTNYARQWLELRSRRETLKDREIDVLRQLTSKFARECLRQAHIVITTCDNAWTLDPDDFPAKILVLDECSQAIEPAALLPVVRFTKSLEQVILGGDDQQLQPFVLSGPGDNEFEPQLRKSWFERARLSAVVPRVTLGRQYRMRPEISRIIIKCFYQNKLQDDESTGVDRPAYINYMCLAKELNEAGMGWPVSNVLMVDMQEGARSYSQMDSTNSRFNNGHVVIVRDLCLSLLRPDANIRGQQVAILTPYAAQRVRHIRALKTAAVNNPELHNVVVSTVDKFQGQEVDIVLLDLVIRSKRNSALGFMKDRNRLNVAISRARDVLIVLGDGSKYQRLLAKPKVAKQSRLFLEVMCDIATHTMIWNVDKSEYRDIDEWDMIEGGEVEGMDEEEGEITD